MCRAKIAAGRARAWGNSNAGGTETHTLKCIRLCRSGNCMGEAKNALESGSGGGECNNVACANYAKCVCFRQDFGYSEIRRHLLWRKLWWNGVCARTSGTMFVSSVCRITLEVCCLVFVIECVWRAVQNVQYHSTVSSRRNCGRSMSL